MKASVQYNDLVGTAAADITDFIGGNSLDEIAKYVQLDTERFKLVGLSIYGTEKPSISLICIDKEQSQGGKEYIVNMNLFDTIISKEELLSIILKRLHIVLYQKGDHKYSSLDCDEEVSYNDYHNPEQ
jgi:hypothetical protein|uniref:Uncharacterized protein n=1 Tax=Siphoviridae sp. cttdo1 TaxID=2823606 RepID=A0A8S5LC30_9CAUD|nr:MAG TPA: hypothetical protein [Siphoviridae sp. cttdo1]